MDELTNQTPPVEYPAVVIGGRTLTLKSGLLADFVLDRRQIDTTQILPILRANKAGSRSLIIELFAALVAHNFVELGEPIPTAEQWCLRLGTDVLRDLGTKLIRALFPNIPAPTDAPGAGSSDPKAATPGVQ